RRRDCRRRALAGADPLVAPGRAVERRERLEQRLRIARHHVGRDVVLVAPRMVGVDEEGGRRSSGKPPVQHSRRRGCAETDRDAGGAWLGSRRPLVSAWAGAASATGTWPGGGTRGSRNGRFRWTGPLAASATARAARRRHTRAAFGISTGTPGSTNHRTALPKR